mgnify:FL=1
MKNNPIIENLLEYLDKSKNNMSSYGLKHVENSNYKNIFTPMNSGTFIKKNRLKDFLHKFLQKKIWGDKIFKNKFFLNYKKLCDKQNRLIDTNLIWHAFVLQLLDQHKLLEKNICTIGDGKANFVNGCLMLNKNIRIYSINLPQALIQDYMIINQFNLLEDQFIKVVNQEKDLEEDNIKLFLVPAENKMMMKNKEINLFTNMACFQEIPEKDTKDYFNIIKSNKAHLYCCNREEKPMYDGNIIKFKDYPFDEFNKIFYEPCKFAEKYYTLRPPFVRDYPTFIHCLINYK